MALVTVREIAPVGEEPHPGLARQDSEFVAYVSVFSQHNLILPEFIGDLGKLDLIKCVYGGLELSLSLFSLPLQLPQNYILFKSGHNWFENNRLINLNL
jgi:hypothetical protein